MTVFLIVTEKQQIERDKLKVYQVKNTPKKSAFRPKKTKPISQNKYFKISLIYSNIVSSKNLFVFEQIEADNRVDVTLIFEEINKELEDTYWKKVLILIQQTVF